ncbi:MAG: hypothetical protein HUJ91_07395 [Bacteroidales bacterium]|nr:hypothetical protein [Bacteroidales bacterium]
MEKFIGDSLYRYTVVPWKAVYIFLETNHTATRYYTREGKEKARVSTNFFAAIKQGADNRDYYETYRTYKSGETKLVKNWYNYGIDYVRKPDKRDYYYNPGRCDKMGNWTYAEDIYANKKGIVRELYYYDTPGYDPEEDAEINQRIATLVKEVKAQDNPFSLTSLPSTVFAFCVRLLFFFGLFILFMLVFRRQSLYLWFDVKATRKITPWGNALYCRTVWYAFIPVLLIFYPTVSYVLGGGTTAVIHNNLILSTVINLGIVGIYCLIFILFRSRRYSARCAVWELLYSATLWVTLWASLLLAFIVLLICLAVLVIAGILSSDGTSSGTEEDAKDNMYVTSWDGECQNLSHISGNYYMDTSGNMYSSGGGMHRLGDLKRFS